MSRRLLQAAIALALAACAAETSPGRTAPSGSSPPTLPPGPTASPGESLVVVNWWSCEASKHRGFEVFVAVSPDVMAQTDCDWLSSFVTLDSGEVWLTALGFGSPPLPEAVGVSQCAYRRPGDVEQGRNLLAVIVNDETPGHAAGQLLCEQLRAAWRG